ncbi:hypothetical protein FACS189488_02810 [Betaproteobacteria bacterium]|nr:hypothetical protein FACS189488_02810 [Betaproteobacteria bacterium]
MGSTFQSNDTPVSDILKAIDQGVNQLPDFQRGWVWDDDRIRALIASISNSYPVGALMFLEYGGDTVRFKYRPFTGSTADCKPEILVLDGQQRLTSIYGAMFCKNAVPTKTDKNREIKRFYYLDVEKCLSSSTDRVDAVLSLPEDRVIRENFGRDVVLDLSTKENEFKQHMFPLNIVYDPIASEAWKDDYREYHNYDKELQVRLRQFNAGILVPIQSYKAPVITLGKDTPKDAVCQVFENVNTGGVSLTVFELITATFAAENFELRKDWDARHEKFAQKSDLLSDVSSTDFLTAITLLSRYYIRKAGGEAVSCKKKDVLAITLSAYQEYADALTEGFIKSSNFLKEQRIFTARDLPYTTQLIPLSVLFTILDVRAHDSTVKNKISRWFWCGVFGEMYGGANETRYANDVTGVTEWVDGGVEPDTVTRAYFQPTRLLSLQTRLSAAYKGVMALVLKAGALDFISGTDMGFTNFTEQAVDIHHIFPKTYSENKYKREQWNSIVNKTPLSAHTNRTIGGSAPSRYLEKIERDDHVDASDLDRYVATHMIDISDIRADNFECYFVKRAKALLGLISSAMGKGIPNLGGDDVVAAFGASLE